MKLTTATAGASIHYTLDGTVPTAASELYSGVIYVGKSKTIKAIAVKEGWKPSDISSFEYIVSADKPDPTPTPIATPEPTPSPTIEPTTRPTTAPTSGSGVPQVVATAEQQGEFKRKCRQCNRQHHPYSNTSAEQ